MSIIDVVPRLLPADIVATVRGTPLERVYWTLKHRDTEYTSVSVPTSVGLIELRSAVEAPFLDIIDREGTYEPLLVAELDRVLDSSSVFYDVGSHRGFFILVALACGVPADRIHGFEASLGHHDVLQGNVPSGVRTTRARVGEPATAELSLDQYTGNHPAPDVMKIDVEGAEVAVVRGATNLLEQHSPLLYVEVHPEYISERGSSTAALLELLEDLGYSLEVALDHREAAGCFRPAEEVAPLPESGDFLLSAAIDS